MRVIWPNIHQFTFFVTMAGFPWLSVSCHEQTFIHIYIRSLNRYARHNFSTDKKKRNYILTCDEDFLSLEIFFLSYCTSTVWYPQHNITRWCIVNWHNTTCSDVLNAVPTDSVLVVSSTKNTIYISTRRETISKLFIKTSMKI